MGKTINVAAYQGSVIEGNFHKNLAKAKMVLQQAEKQQVDIICFPECFLHGYFSDPKDAFEYSFSLNSKELEHVCDQLGSNQSTVIIGFNERWGEKLYNAALVIERGKFVGIYRKSFTYPPYDYYALGSEYPVFEKNGIRFGIIICYDLNFLEPARILALKGATLLFCPMFNRVKIGDKVLSSLHQKAHFSARSGENSCWLIASDILHLPDENFIGAGYSCIANRDGEILCSAPPFYNGLLTYQIPYEQLLEQKEKRLKGRPDLFQEMVRCYQMRFGIELFPFQ